MGWWERDGGDERAAIAARARALLEGAGSPPPVVGPVDPAPAPVATPVEEPPAPRRGGWVPTTSALLAAGLPHEVPGPVDPFGPLEPDRTPAPPGTGRRGGGARPDQPRLERWRDRVRWDPGRRGLVAVAAVVVVVGSVAGGAVLRTGSSSAVTVAGASGLPPSAAAAAPVAGASGSSSAPAAGRGSPTPSASPKGEVTVDVAGLVLRPGVYTLPAGARVEDALAAAGGPQPGADLTTLNRARVLVDGEQLAVGVPGATGAPAASGPAAGSGAVGSSGPAGLVDLNTADVGQLDTLPGVGPVLAQAIVSWRGEHGRFATVDDLDQVAGIGPATFAKLRDLVTV